MADDSYNRSPSDVPNLGKRLHTGTKSVDVPANADDGTTVDQPDLRVHEPVVQIGDAEENVRAAVVGEPPQEDAYAVAVRMIGGEEQLKLANKIQFLQLVELVKINRALELKR